MTFAFVADPSGTPAWHGVLPGGPRPYVLPAGQGEHAKLFHDVFTVLCSGDETGGQFGMFTQRGPAGERIPTHRHGATNETFFVIEGRVRLYVEQDGTKVTQLLGPGDFAYVPAGCAHAYRVEEACWMLGTASGGFERFFAAMGTPTDHPTPGGPPFVPDGARIAAAAAAHDNHFLPEFTWPE